ncbi:unnamed protein product [Oncorhynchus mykiss]|uniref:Major facilitator superfamily (MFS) profile domain-containing protein n=1 Tax=Oncorhynchus mykiss TaxID=8022 RepID=A0A060XT17_ONCMY|nr:unnamed protein product [Oncorhynchus mykiss]
MIALLCLFGGISIASWNALDVLTVELYPSDKRCTAFGFLNALCKLAAVLGISIFTSFVGITKAVPILFASGALAAGSFLAFKLPETRGQHIVHSMYDPLIYIGTSSRYHIPQNRHALVYTSKPFTDGLVTADL